MGKSQVPAKPFGKIALSCSGGGYRAASFHLGSMSYLNHSKYDDESLLEHVKLLSTVSGGSITGVVYALMKQQGKSFDEIYQFLLEKLMTIDLLQTGIEKLNPNAIWPNPFKSKNLINAFADQYDQVFTRGAVMAEFEVMKSHLEAVVFNCTEFENALNFRFRNLKSNYSGNFYNRITAKQLREVKLADVMASSSCFPGGFEPMRWPDDYVHEHSPNLKMQAEKNASEGVTPLGVMDGGIYDNQGIDSILLYEEKADQPYFDLVILSDVASPDMKAYIPFKEKPKTGFRALRLKDVKNKVQRFNQLLNLGLWVVMIAGLTAPFVFNMSGNWLAGVCWSLSALAIILLVAKLYLKKRIHRFLLSMLFKIRGHIPPFYLKRLGVFDVDELSVHRAEPLIVDRINSLLMLLTTVFLKVVRRLNYNRLYDDETYKFRRFSTLIKCLSRDNLAGSSELKSEADVKLAEKKAPKKISFFTGNYEQDIGQAIAAVVEEAAGFGTTLWFTEQEKLDNVLKKLVATGQITMCYNLILYMEELMYAKDGNYEGLDLAVREAIKAFYDRCIADWLLFKNDPMYLVRQA